MHHRKVAGFSLVETMVVVVVLGILLAAAVPGYNRGNRSRRVEGSAQEIASSLQLARQRSVSSRLPHRLVYLPDESSCRIEQMVNDSTWDAVDLGQVSIPVSVSLAWSAGGDASNTDIEFEGRGTVLDDDAPLSVIVTNDYGDTFSVSLVRTGRVTVRRGLIN